MTAMVVGDYSSVSECLAVDNTLFLQALEWCEERWSRSLLSMCLV